MQCCYNAVNFLESIIKRHCIARPTGWGMECLCGSSIWLIFCLSSCNSISYYIGPCYNGTWLYNFINPGEWFAPFTAKGAAVEEGIFAMNIVKKSTHAVINKIRPLIFSYVFVSINYMNASWYWWDWGSVYDFFVTIKEIWSQNFSI